MSQINIIACVESFQSFCCCCCCCCCLQHIHILSNCRNGH